MKIKVTAIILKYKTDCKELSLHLKDIGVDKVLIVDNSEYNRGTAGGFAEGMRQVKDGWIWLFDEDNYPTSDCLDIIKKWLKYFEDMSPVYRVSIACNRYSYLNVKDIYSIIGTDNATYGFDIFHPIKVRRNKKVIHNKNRSISVAMWGGLFFHSSWIKRIGLPNESYFMYSDDFEWTYRITKDDGIIHLLHNAVITEPFHNTGNKYLRVRNAIRFAEQFITSKFQYRVNKFLFSLIQLIKFDMVKFKAINYKYFEKKNYGKPRPELMVRGTRV